MAAKGLPLEVFMMRMTSTLPLVAFNVLFHYNNNNKSTNQSSIWSTTTVLLGNKKKKKCRAEFKHGNLCSSKGEESTWTCAIGSVRRGLPLCKSSCCLAHACHLQLWAFQRFQILPSNSECGIPSVARYSPLTECMLPLDLNTLTSGGLYTFAVLHTYIHTYILSLSVFMCVCVSVCMYVCVESKYGRHWCLFVGFCRSK